MKLVDIDTLKLIFNSVHNFMTALNPDEPQKYSYNYIMGMFDRAPAAKCLYVIDDGEGEVGVLEYSYWIPCDKSHLPELYKPVFASIKSGDKEWIEIVSLHKKYMSDSFYWSAAGGFLKTIEFDKVKAWAPLPPVYKEKNK